MTEASVWVKEMSKPGRAVLVAYPLSFDWSWLYWYLSDSPVMGPLSVILDALISRLPSP